MRTKVSAKKEQNTTAETNKFFTIKETYVRQMSEVPDYAKNMYRINIILEWNRAKSKPLRSASDLSLPEKHQLGSDHGDKEIQKDLSLQKRNKVHF